MDWGYFKRGTGPDNLAKTGYFRGADLDKLCNRDADILQLHPASHRDQWNDTGTNGKHPDQSHWEPLGTMTDWQ
jgi:hypothetical protein